MGHVLSYGTFFLSIKLVRSGATCNLRHRSICPMVSFVLKKCTFDNNHTVWLHCFPYKRSDVSFQINVEDTLSPLTPLKADTVTETGFCPRIHKHTLILRNPSLSALIVLGTAGLFVLLISLSQWLVELPLSPPLPHPSSSFSNLWAKPSLCLLRGALVITPTHL